MLRPLSNRLVLKIEKEEEKKVGGLLLPGSAKVNENVALVVAVADDVEAVKVGDRVVYESLAGLRMTDEGDDYVIVKLENVVAVVE